MSTKTIIWICLTIGSTVGSYVPILWGNSFLSYSSLLLGGVGGIVGVLVGLKIGNRMNG
jgi:hypothetical protein